MADKTKTNKTPKAPLTEAQKAERAAAKVAKFNELAPKRMTAALAKVRLIGNLSSKAGYSYTDEQVAKMRKALNDAVSETMDRFSATGGNKSDGFTF
jgi:hypothetical protein